VVTDKLLLLKANGSGLKQLIL